MDPKVPPEEKVIVPVDDEPEDEEVEEPVENPEEEA